MIKLQLLPIVLTLSTENEISCEKDKMDLLTQGFLLRCNNEINHLQ